MVDLNELGDLSLGKAIKYLREARGLTQDEFAEEIGMTQKWNSDIERGMYKHSTPETLFRISEFFGIPDYILLAKAGFGKDQASASQFHELTKPDPEEHEQNKQALADMRTEAHTMIDRLRPMTLVAVLHLLRVMGRP
jgi:transcriptional regulator with XRE-family HTH domain